MRTFKLFIDRKPMGNYDLWGYSLYEYTAGFTQLIKHNTKHFMDSKQSTLSKAIRCYNWGIESVAPVIAKYDDTTEVVIFITNNSVYRRLENNAITSYRIEMESLKEAIDKIYGTVYIEYINDMRNKNVLCENTVEKEKYDKVSDFINNFS